MMKWLLDWVRRAVGHWLLADEEAEEKKRDEERARKQKEIIDANYTAEDVARDLDDGKF